MLQKQSWTDRGHATLTPKAAADEDVWHLRRAYVTRKRAKTGAELETGADLTVHWLLKYCITKFSLIRGCFNRHDEHKHSQDQHCITKRSQTHNRAGELWTGWEEKRENWGETWASQQEEEEEASVEHRWEEEQVGRTLSTGYSCKCDTAAHANKKSKHFNPKIIAFMWKNILQLFQLHHFHPQLPLQKHVTVGAGKIMRI